MAGKVAMTVAQSGNLARARKAPFALGIAPIPGRSGPVSKLSDSAIVVFSRYAEAKRAAIAEALAFLTGQELQGHNGSVPIRGSLAGGSRVSPDLIHAFEHARGTPLVSAWASIEFELARYLSLAYQYRSQSPSSR